VTGGWRELHNEELHKLHYLLNVIRMIKGMGRACSMYGSELEWIQISGGKARKKEDQYVDRISEE
jgi:hypothetical protein